MKINEKMKKCVAFLQYKMADGNFHYAGTCFFVIHESGEKDYPFVVTARHVIQGVQGTGIDRIYIRMNLGDGTSKKIETFIREWFIDGISDIAVRSFNFGEEFDHLYYGESLFLSDDKIKENEINCGDEVYITGLFKYHAGDVLNIPIVRIGNIAMFPEQAISLKDGLQDAYLIESRSIGGLSGSPVFINLGEVRKIGGKVKHAQGEHIHPIMGIVRGHYDSGVDDIDFLEDCTEDAKKINVGIAIVTPIKKLVDLFNRIKYE